MVYLPSLTITREQLKKRLITLAQSSDPKMFWALTNAHYLLPYDFREFTESKHHSVPVGPDLVRA
jgi:hypothetical protein